MIIFPLHQHISSFIVYFKNTHLSGLQFFFFFLRWQYVQGIFRLQFWLSEYQLKQPMPFCVYMYVFLSVRIFISGEAIVIYSSSNVYLFEDEIS